ncbi:expansin-A9-like [Salvia miltiorrhiza]|uniref:expansin-A9-like n=1 Tax=Salvia miltiorrhiza TaxID=226208 RepID=UPI0025AD49C6|nr:expansin-A9-like [Salvia miltiorrhiza]
MSTVTAATSQAILPSLVILMVALAHAHEHQHAEDDHTHHATRRHAHEHEHGSHPHPHAHHEHEHPHARSHPHAHHEHEHPHAHHEHENTHRRHGPLPQTCPSPDQGPEPGAWKDAHATFYGAPDGTIGGACGYEESDKQIYGSETTALSTVLFEDGMACGACFEIKCSEPSEWCKPGQPTVHITATDFCPPGGEGWCNSPKEHFDLSQPAFHKIAEHKGGIVPVKYRRVPCKRHGGIRFKVTGNPYFNMIGITNVGGAGDVSKVEVKVGEQWVALKHNYGDKWDTNEHLVGKKLTFRITTGDGKSVITEQAAPQDWQFGKTYQGKNVA